MPQTQEEFYFGHPYERMDILIWGYAHGIEPKELSDRVGSRARRRGDRLPGDRATPCRDRVPPRPSDPVRPAGLSMCGLAGIVRPARLGASRRAGTPPHGGSDRPPWPRRVRTRTRRGCGPRLGAARDLRHPPRLAAVRGFGRAEACSSTTARSTTTRSCGPSLPRAETPSRRPVTPRSCCDCWSATGVRALERLNGQFAFAWWQPERRRLTLVRDRFGVRPLYYALLGDGTLVFGSEAKALFASGEVDRGARSRRNRRGLHALGPARAADDVSRRQPGEAGRARRLGARPDRRRADVVEPRSTTSTESPTPISRSSCATACGCACAPTSRWAPISRAGSTRA